MKKYILFFFLLFGICSSVEANHFSDCEAQMGWHGIPLSPTQEAIKVLKDVGPQYLVVYVRDVRPIATGLTYGVNQFNLFFDAEAVGISRGLPTANLILSPIMKSQIGDSLSSSLMGNVNDAPAQGLVVIRPEVLERSGWNAGNLVSQTERQISSESRPQDLQSFFTSLSEAHEKHTVIYYHGKIEGDDIITFILPDPGIHDGIQLDRWFELHMGKLTADERNLVRAKIQFSNAFFPFSIFKKARWLGPVKTAKKKSSNNKA